MGREIFVFEIWYGCNENTPYCKRYMFYTNKREKCVEYIEKEIERFVEENKMNNIWKHHYYIETDIENGDYTVRVLE